MQCAFLTQLVIGYGLATIGRVAAGKEEAPAAVWWLNPSTIQRADLEESRSRTDTGEGKAPSQLARAPAGQVTEQGRNDEAQRLVHFGPNPDGSIASA
jgi:ubiquitin